MTWTLFGDRLLAAPGAETPRELFGGKPALVLLDELSVQLCARCAGSTTPTTITAFLTLLFKATERAPGWFEYPGMV